MSRFWSPVVHRLTPYVPGEQPKLPGLIKLNTNENPYGPSPLAMAAIATANTESLRLYPDPNADALKQAIATRHGVTVREVFVGNSSDEVLAHVFMALLRHDRPLRFPDITYSFYPVYCGLYDVAYDTVPLDGNFEIAVDDYIAHPAGPCGAVIFPNPNAPTGRIVSLDDVARLASALPDTVICIDEAYIDFAGDTIPTAITLVNRYPNLLVVQTLSKSRSLAGLRVGFAIGHPELIEALERVKNSFNSYPLDRLAIAGATAAMTDDAWFEKTRRAVIASRKQLAAAMTSLGFEVLPSAANFIFARHPDHDAGELAASLRRRNIVVRHFRLPRIEQFLRISIGTDDECAQLVTALRQIIV